MKLDQLFESKIKIGSAYLEYGWNSEIFDEEDDDYLPDWVSKDKVLELKLVDVGDQIGKGIGKKLFDKFMQTKSAKSAELIFLDVNPHYSNFPEDVALQKLKQIYSSWGFRSNGHSNRMWIVQKQEIKDADLPS